MTGKTRKQLAFLAVLVAALVAVMFVAPRGDGPAGSRVPTGPAGRTAAQAAPPPVVDVRLEILKVEREAPADPERNLFVFRPKAPPPPPPQPPGPPKVEAPPPVPTGPPPPPPIPLKFIGVLESPGGAGKVAILSDGRGGTYHGREGDTILGQYKVLKIGTESAELSYVDGRGRQTLRLSGQ